MPDGPPMLVGIGYRREIADQIAANSSSIDCLELLVEHFLPLTPRRRAELERLCETFAVILHGVGLSPASCCLPPEPYWEGVRELLRITEAPFLGEHAALTRGGGYDLWSLSPMWRTNASLDVLVENLQIARDRLGVPVVLETITEMLEIPGAELGWDAFLVEAANRADTELLIDVTNIWINRENGITPERDELYGALGEARWAQFHIVGASRDAEGFLIDSHDAEISETLIAAFSEAVGIQPAPFTILERDGELDAFDEVLADIDRLKRVIAATPTTAR